MGFAWIYLGLGEHDAALEWLQKTYDERPNMELAFINTGTIWDSVRADPRFIFLVKKIGLKK